MSVNDIKMRDFSDEIDKSLDLLFKVKEENGKKTLLLEKPKIVYLQVMLFKIPFTYARKRKFVYLRHSLYGDDPDICLFVPNRKTGVPYKKTTDELIDFCVDFYTDFLEKHKVKGISTIMPLKQLSSEYGAYELRRKLVRTFDLFLCKNSLLYKSKFIKALGKHFKVANKIPLGVPFPRENVDFSPEFQKNIQKAILTSPFYVSRYSDNYSIPIGLVSHTKKELKENIQMVLEQLLKNNIIPGGFQNVRALYLWPSQSRSIPLYICTEVPVNMKTPRERVRKRKVKGIKGELSTQPNKEVYVTPHGEVFVTKLRKHSQTVEEIENDDEDDDDYDDEEPFKDESDEENEEEKKENLKGKIKPTEEKEEETDTEDDEEIEEKEARLLEEKWQAEEEEEDEEEEKEESDTDVKPPRPIKKEKNGILSKKRKRKNAGGSDDEEPNVAKKKKSGKAGGKEKVNKAKRKMLMKREKEKINQKKKSKQKKV